MTPAPCTATTIASYAALMREHPNVTSVVCAHGTTYQLTVQGGVLATAADGRVLHLLVPAADAKPVPSSRCPEPLRRRIKMSQKRAGLSDAAYRVKLRELTGKTSSTELTEAEAQTVARALEELATA